MSKTFVQLTMDDPVIRGPGRPPLPSSQRRITKQVRMTEYEKALLPYQRCLWDAFMAMRKQSNTSPRWHHFNRLVAQVREDLECDDFLLFESND